MKSAVRLLTLGALLSLALAAPASAQYMYIDANRDGVWTEDDRLRSDTTTVLVWLDTNHDKDTSARVCNDHTGAPSTTETLDLFSYDVIFHATGGTVGYSLWSPASGFGPFGTEYQGATDATAHRALPLGTNVSGLQLLGWMKVTVLSGSPKIDIVDATSIDPNGFATLFGTNCDGSDFPSSYVRGLDWSDVDGAAAPLGGNTLPAITAPATASGAENTPIATITATATDVDAANTLTITQAGKPASLTFTTVAGISPRTATITGTPGFADAGSYTITWSVSDGAGGSATTATVLTISNTNQIPSITAPSTASGAEGTPIATITATATDGDAANTLTITQTGKPASLTFTHAPGGSPRTATITGTPNFTEANTYTITWSVNDGASGTAAATTVLTIANTNQNPSITAPATAGGSEGVPIATITATATDGDAANTLTITQAGKPAGLTFTTSPGSSPRTATITGTPGSTEAGSYTITWSVSDGAGGTAATTTALTITESNQIPSITAPSTASGAEGTPIATITATATDADASNTLTITQAGKPASLTFTHAPGGSPRTATITGTPNFTEANTYTITWSVSDGVGGTRATTTALTIANTNQNPSITAPATAGGSEGTPIATITATATDGDAANTLTITQAGKPVSLTFTTSPGSSPRTATITGTPGSTEAGSYTITWSVSDGAGGTAATTTALTITESNQNPSITAPSTASGAEGTPIATITATATDGDAANTLTITQAGKPASLTFTHAPGGSPRTATITGTPVFSDAGSYTITWSVSDGVGGTAAATTVLTIANTNQNPSITAPATAGGSEGVPIATITATATDGDAANTLTITQAGKPAGLTFTTSPGSSPRTATITGTPGSTEAGSYTITWSVSDGAGGTAATTTALTITESNQIPSITAPSTASGAEGTPIATITATATDGDAANTLTITQAGKPASLTFTHAPGGSPRTATITGTPVFSDAGSYTITWSVSDGVGGTAAATTVLTIANTNRTPSITAPATAGGSEGTPIATITATATDLDLSDVMTISQTGKPTDLTFTASPGPSPRTATITGTPGFSDAGGYTITWSVNDGLGGTAATTTALTIANTNQNPSITAPSTASGVENTPIATITATATDGDAANTLTISQTGKPASLTFTASPGPSPRTATITGTPSPSDLGTHTISWSVTDGAGGSAGAATVLTITHTNQNPSITAPGTASGVENTPIATITATATDPDATDILTISQTGKPLDLVFSTSPGASPRTATITGTPGFSDSGSYTITWSVSDGAGGTAATTTVLTIGNTNRTPTADPNGPYVGVVGVNIQFSGSGSSDQDGNGLTWHWTFGDGGTSNDTNPLHAYGTAGSYNVCLYVVDDGAVNPGVPPLTSATVCTTADVLNQFPANAFLTGGNKTIRLASGKPSWCAQIEPSGGQTAADVVLSSIVAKFGGAQISASASKTILDGDKDHNGLTEIAACFTKADLRLLFASLPTGKRFVNVDLEGSIVTGGGFRATVNVEVVKSGAVVAVTASPNPLNPETTISFALGGQGRVKLEIFDVQGRLVKTLADEVMAGGDHEVRWDGRTRSGLRAASGAYYYVLNTHEGRAVNHLIVLK